MEPQTILAILDGISDPRNAGKLTRADYANANAALLALQQHFQSLIASVPAPVAEVESVQVATP